MVFVMRCGDENRKVKNSHSARAMAKGSRFGRLEQEPAWQSAEVDAHGDATQA